MSIHVRAIYENGVFRPLESVELTEKQEVTVTINEQVANRSRFDDQVRFVLPPDRWQAFCDALDAEPKEIPALRKLLTEESLFDDAGADSTASTA